MRTSLLLGCTLAFLLSSCEEEDATSARLRLRSGGAGEMYTSCLLQVPEPGPVDGQVGGANTTARVGLVASSGRYADINQLTLADIRFKSGSSEAGLRWLEVTIPQGPDARWPRLFVPMEDTARLDAVSAFTSDSRAREIGAAFKLEIELPETVVSQGLAGTRVRGARGESEAKTATLTLPVERARQANGPLSWQLTWAE